MHQEKSEQQPQGHLLEMQTLKPPPRSTELEMPLYLLFSCCLKKIKRIIHWNTPSDEYIGKLLLTICNQQAIFLYSFWNYVYTTYS